MTKQKEKRMVVVTTDKDKRGVFFGEFVSHDETKKIAVLKNAQMAIYWSSATKGILGLASIGPQKGSRISPVVPSIKLDGVTSVMDTTNEAVEKWKMQIWS